MRTGKIDNQELQCEMVSIPKDVFESALCELFGISSIFFRVNDLLGETIFGGPIFTALEMMGYGEYHTPERFKSNVFQIIDYHASKMKKPISKTDAQKIGKKILKDVKVEINKLNRNPRHYE